MVLPFSLVFHCDRVLKAVGSFQSQPKQQCGGRIRPSAIISEARNRKEVLPVGSSACKGTSKRRLLTRSNHQAHNAYERGDGAAAHELSEEGKRHGQAADAYNKQASDFIFRENNAVGRVAGDTIDLHGQFVEEAEEILEQRIRYAQSQGQTHLHV